MKTFFLLVIEVWSFVSVLRWGPCSLILWLPSLGYYCTFPNQLHILTTRVERVGNIPCSVKYLNLMVSDQEDHWTAAPLLVFSLSEVEVGQDRSWDHMAAMTFQSCRIIDHRHSWMNSKQSQADSPLPSPSYEVVCTALKRHEHHLQHLFLKIKKLSFITLFRQLGRYGNRIWLTLLLLKRQRPLPIARPRWTFGEGALLVDFR